MKAIIAVPATFLLCYRAYSRNSLTPAGIFAALLTAIAHAVHPWNLPFALLVVFFLAGTRVTHIKQDIKASLTLASKGTSGGEGPRTHVQVLANSLVASVLTLLHAYQLHQRKNALLASPGAAAGSFCFSWGGDLLVVGIIANYAAVAADTFSSELGILARSEPRLITSLTLRRVPRGTNGGVTLLGLGAGLLGSMIVVTAAVVFLPWCNATTAGTPGGGSGSWTIAQRRELMLGMTVWGALGSLLDSFLGGMFQRSVKDVRSGKIVEGEGGVRVLVSAKSNPNSPDHFSKKGKIKTKMLSGEGKDAVEKQDMTSNQAASRDATSKGRKPSFGDQQPSRAVESGWDLLDNNDVNFLMAFTMSMGAMGVASWYWNVPFSQILRL